MSCDTVYRKLYIVEAPGAYLYTTVTYMTLALLEFELFFKLQYVAFEWCVAALIPLGNTFCRHTCCY